MKREDQAWLIIGVLEDADSVLWMDDLVDQTGLSGSTIKEAIFYARHNILPALGINLVCNRQTYGYSLTKDHAIVMSGTRIQKKDTRTRVKTLYLASIIDVKNTDGRTTEGREARLIKMHMGRLWEDLNFVATGELVDLSA